MGVTCGSLRIEVSSAQRRRCDPGWKAASRRSPPTDFRILEAGLLDFEQIDYPNIPKRRRAAFTGR
jgi:hypothetical protein